MSKEIIGKDQLEIGKLYTTSDHQNTVLEFVGLHPVFESILFKHISGPEVYVEDSHGYVGFMSWNKYMRYEE